MIIKILGSGCSNCRKLDIEASIEKVENIQDIIAYGVMRTPALVVDGQVKVSGRLLSVENIKKYL